ncbi:MAG: PmoA family protein, partial [Planctomycetota bacterium]
LKIDGATITSTNDWKDGKGEVVCSDKRVITFGALSDARLIDYDVTWIASNGDVHIGDTKEGTMGIRTHPQLRLKANPKRGNKNVSGHSVNSEGVRDGAMWGKRAAWVDYWGKIDGKLVGVAIFDHPSNPRHPTWWHARDYGLVAANPFGVNHFEGKPDGTGDMTIKSGETLSFRYRFVFHEGDVEAAKIAERYEAYRGD